MLCRLLFGLLFGNSQSLLKLTAECLGLYECAIGGRLSFFGPRQGRLQRGDARHWLALTREISANTTVLSNDAVASMRRVLTETENAPTPAAGTPAAPPAR